MKTKIMIIDDHALFNDGLAHLLSDSPSFEVVRQVYQSRHAVHCCLQYSPDLVLVDYNMPEMNGLEVVRELKMVNAALKIVVISMYADRREILRFLQEGVDGYIVKTTPYRELIGNLESIMAGKKVFPDGAEGRNREQRDVFQVKLRITKRELEILKLVAKGMSTVEIAGVLNLSYYTVETHRRNVNTKLKGLPRNDYQEFIDSLNL